MWQQQPAPAQSWGTDKGWWRRGFLVAPFLLLWQHRHLLWQTVRNDLRARYAGSVLGLAWLVLYPLLFLGAYALVYLYVFKVRFALFDSAEYVALMFCGLVPFLAFAEALGAGIPAVTSNAHLVKNTLFPIDLIPVKAVLNGVLGQLSGIGLLLAALGLLGRLTPFALLLPAVILAQLAFTIGVVWVLSAMNVYLRDLQHIVALLTLLLMLLTPIAYTAEMAPDRLRSLLTLNPLYYIVVCYQEVLMMGRWPVGHMLERLALLGGSAFIVGYWFFARLKSAFVDEL
jgi:lipopolysaccharide transport system permease protein